MFFLNKSPKRSVAKNVFPTGSPCGEHPGGRKSELVLYLQDEGKLPESGGHLSKSAMDATLGDSIRPASISAAACTEPTLKTHMCFFQLIIIIIIIIMFSQSPIPSIRRKKHSKPTCCAEAVVSNTRRSTDVPDATLDTSNHQEFWITAHMKNSEFFWLKLSSHLFIRNVTEWVWFRFQNTGPQDSTFLHGTWQTHLQHPQYPATKKCVSHTKY